MLKRGLTLIIIMLVGVWDAHARFQQKEEYHSFAEYKRLLEAGHSKHIREKISRGLGLSEDAEKYLLSLSYFYEGEYGEALKTAVRIKDEKILKEEKYFFALMRAVYALTAVFERERLGAVEFRGSGRDLILKDDAAVVVELGIESLRRGLGYVPDSVILLEVFPDKKSFAIASTLGEKVLEHSGAVGICKFNRLMIISPRNLPFGFRWKDTIVHEMVHLAVNYLSDSNCPLWLHEGIARYFDSAWRKDIDSQGYLTPSQKKELVSAVKKNSIIPFERMHPSLVYLDSQEDMNLAFSQSASMVEFMRLRYGNDIIPRLLDKLKTNDFADSLKAVVGTDFSGLVKEWMAFVGLWEAEDYQGEAQDIYVFDASKDEVDIFVKEEMRDNIRLGDRFFAQNRFELARQHYNEALKNEPKNAVVLNKLARVMLIESDYENAEKVLALSVESSPNYGSSYIMMGDMFFELSQPQKAAAFYTEALDINPFNHNVRKRLALMKLELGDSKKAADEFEKCLILSPGDREIVQILEKIRRRE